MIVLAAAAVALPAAGAAPTRAELERVDRDLALERAALERLSRRGESVLEELDRWEAAASPLDDVARSAQAAAEAAAAAVTAAETREVEARRRLRDELDALAPRLVARYRLNRSATTRFLVSSTSATTWLRRRHQLGILLAHDLVALRRTRGLADELTARRVELDRRRAEAAGAAREAAERVAAARGKRASLARIHQRILEEQSLRGRAVTELTAAHARLADLIAQSRVAAYTGKSVFAESKGNLPYPTRGLVEVGYGKVVNPKFQTVTFQKGLDIRADSGTPVVSVAPGKVVHSGWFRGYGNLVIIDHGEGWHTLAAHLATMTKAIGDEVGAEAAIGTVGETGSLKGPYLYFEVRHRGKPVDPAEWLGRPAE